MLKIQTVLSLFLFCIATASAQQTPAWPQVFSGKVVRHAQFPSRFVPARTIDVWLPEGYSAFGKYDILYMHDGQMLFDSSQTWNRQEWGVDEMMAGLINCNLIRPAIVVGIWNSGASRHAEYFPEEVYKSLSEHDQKRLTQAKRSGGQDYFSDTIRSDAYLRFVVEELKPFIDSTYATYGGRKHTFIAGSSMGGLISIYALCKYPQVFGGAACLSTHWIGVENLDQNPVPDAMVRYLKQHLPKARKHKIYFDHGTIGLESQYAAPQLRVDAVMRDRQYCTRNWLTRVFPDTDHSERSWRERLSVPLEFLLAR